MKEGLLSSQALQSHCYSVNDSCALDLYLQAQKYCLYHMLL
jgi:hypothetical protein